jgi:hypothetical protein
MAGDPLADAYNLIGAQEMTGPNPYLQYQGQIPMAGFTGTPTDAEGRPIQSYLNALAQQPTPGTTLNTSPPAAPQAVAPRSGGTSLGGGMNYQGATGQPGNYMAPQFGPAMQSFMAGGPSLWGTPQGGSPAAAPQAAAAQPQGPNLRQAYLDALANPGPLPQYGAVMQPGAAQTGAPQPSVLNQFLAAHPSGGTAVPGGYSNTGFFNTLNRLQAQKGATA